MKIYFNVGQVLWHEGYFEINIIYLIVNEWTGSLFLFGKEKGFFIFDIFWLRVLVKFIRSLNEK